MGQKPRYTVLTPVHCWNQYRIDCIKRAGESLEKQTFKDFEWIVVNDGSTVEFTLPKWAKVINKDHAERVVAYNAGLKKATKVIGVYNRIEVWNDSAWQKYKAKTEGSSEEIAEKMADLGI